ncbi:MAG: hypothetical protein JXA22_03045 [Candidatus Thermoplasmatota archaeon]|nr:hypothetical protein [Candidatus Thermoplasmatota archaeon]
MEIKCPYCSSHRFCIMHSGKDLEIEKLTPMEVDTNDILCKDCGHLFGNPYVFPDGDW